MTPPPYPTPLVEIGPVRFLAIERSVAGSSQRGRVVGSSGGWRVASGEWRVASGGRIVARESEGRGPVVREKRQNEANSPMVLIIGIL